MNAFSTIVHAVLGYIFLTLVVRTLVRRPGGQLTQFEFVLIFLMGGVIILSTVGHDRSVTNCTCAVIAVGGMHCGVSLLKLRFPTFGRIVDGTPLVLIRKGAWQDSVLKGMCLDHEDVMASARTKGVKRPEDIDYAVLERNGTITVLKKQDE
jgi:uncharacterized membrane protein YcaP (DUF421 family)